MSYTNRIKSAMALRGLKQMDMAMKLNMTVSTFNRKLNKSLNSKFDIDEAIQITSILKCTLDEIFLSKEVA
jgi:transcriptional regulator with XRE-family HTH domain